MEADDEPSGPRRPRFDAAGNPWWRPTSTLGRALLACAALVVVSCLAYAFHIAKTFLEHDPRFRIAGSSSIQAVGLGQVSRAEMMPVFGEDIGRNIFFVPLGERRRQLEQIPWVQKATVMRLLPDQIRVSVVERQPVAFVRHGQQIGLVDANGVLLGMPVATMAQRHYSFPVLTGIDPGDPLPSRKARMDVYERLIDELDSSGQHLSDQISEIDLTDPEDARVLMPEQGSDILAHFGEGHFLDRYQRYKSHIAEWRQQYPQLASVDLRYDQQVVLQMSPGASADQAAVSTDNAKPKAGQLAPTRPRPDLANVAGSGSDPFATAPKLHPASKPKTGQKAKEDRVQALAQKMREKKRAEARRAALSKNKKKTTAKPHASRAASQGQ